MTKKTNNPPTPTAPVHQQATASSSVLQTVSRIDSAPRPEATASLDGEGEKKVKKPNDWSVEDVASWLGSKRFDHDVCDKFTKNGIDGSFLFNLNTDIMKNEIGIVSYTMRANIEQAINEIRDEPLPKRQRFDAPEISEEHEQFWKRLWVDQVTPIQDVDVRRDSDRLQDVNVQATMKVLHGLPKIFSQFDVLIREEYNNALSAICQYNSTHKGVIIVGHPGIGKTIFLYYLLVIRLLKRQPTIFQYRPDDVLLYDAEGVTQLSPHSEAAPSAPETWALVDSNESVSTPAPMLIRGSSPYFLVVASSSNSNRWKDVQHYRPPTPVWLMQPFTLVELIQAHQLQLLECKESDVQHFFKTYGPSARDCFAFCSDIKSYHSHVRTNVTQDELGHAENTPI